MDDGCLYVLCLCRCRALTAAVERKLFYDKKKMHVCAGQVVSRRVDRFLFDFFGLADIDFPLRSGGPSEGGRMRLGPLIYYVC